MITEASNPTNTVLVSRGTNSTTDKMHDVAIAAGFTSAYMQDAHQFYQDVLEQQKFPK